MDNSPNGKAMATLRLQLQALRRIRREYEEQLARVRRPEKFIGMADHLDQAIDIMRFGVEDNE